MQKQDIINRAILNGNKINLFIDEHDLMTVKRISTLPGCRYFVLKEMYEIPLKLAYVESLMEWKFICGKSLRDWERTARHDKQLKRLKIRQIPGFSATLYPYQALGVQWVDECNGRALIADEMGLGKTIQALAWCQLHTEIRPVLIICPSFLKINWEREILKWIPDAEVDILDSRKPRKIKGNFVIINYDVLHWWVEDLRRFGFQAMIADEAHFIKNSSAKRTKAFKKIAKWINNIIALTGTPIEQKPIEIYNIINILNPQIFPDYIQFTRKYCDAEKTRFGWDTNGSSNYQELYRILSASVMIRRKKAEVLTELPPKQISVVPLQITNKAEYKQAELEFIKFLSGKFDKDLNEKENIEKELKEYAKKNELEVGDSLSYTDIQNIKELKMSKAKNARVLVQMSMLKQLAVKGKMEAIKEWIEDFLESGEKLVVFAINKIVIQELMKHFPDAVRVDGDVTNKQRQKAVDQFQTDPNCRLFIANIDAGGVGLTLTASSNVALIQFPWTPGKMSQAIDRVHRITQTKQVGVWNLIAAGTIEDKILKVLSEKEKTVHEILDGGNYDGSSVAREILKMYYPKVR